ncbi:MAG: PDZ domain-containing protein [Aquiluna sp.]|jgi:Lon-like protease|nr:PDZ domain-containing protein [Aquiluna sp.]
MTFFSGQSGRGARSLAGWATLSLFLIALGSVFLLPTGFVIERPGQVFNVMGEIDQKPVISSDDLEVYPSESRFDITTVSLVGNREATPNWVQVLLAWVDPKQLVLPLDEVYPPSRSTAEIRAESTALMEISQQDAIAVALKDLGYEVPRNLYISSVLEGTPASRILIAGDLIFEADGVGVTTFDELRSQIQLSNGEPMTIAVSRDGANLDVEITPELRDEAYVIGAMIGYTYDFPATVNLQLGDVGGPSGGLMFSLGIIDALTPGSLAGDNHVAGTGTISPNGEVGPIGGIDLKMIAAKDSGATLFLAPFENCDEVVGAIPSGLSVVAVRDLSEAKSAVEALATGQSLPALGCTN